MAVKLRLKRLGRKHRPFFRVCAMDVRTPRDGRVIEELGYYDPMVPETDARAILNGDRIDYWLSVGAKPTEKVRVLIKKYGKDGTHLDKQTEVLERINAQRQPPLAAEIAASAAATDDAPAESAEAESEVETVDEESDE